MLPTRAWLHMCVWPQILAAMPIAIPVGGVLALCCFTKEAMCAFFFVLTPLLWPVYFLCK